MIKCNISATPGPSVQSVVVKAEEMSPLLGSGSNSNDSTANRQFFTLFSLYFPLLTRTK